MHEVVSLNAANVWMMRSMADGMDRIGDREEVEAWRDEADTLATRLLGRYVPGEGIWAVVDTDGIRRPIRHCYDFICTARFMPDRLDDHTRREMLAFVEHELLTDHWMRALSLADRTAAVSDRPDHGPYGAFDAWPAMAAEAMLLIAAPDAALDLLHRAASATREGPFGQAFELYGPERGHSARPDPHRATGQLPPGGVRRRRLRRDRHRRPVRLPTRPQRIRPVPRPRPHALRGDAAPSPPRRTSAPGRAVGDRRVRGARVSLRRSGDRY